MLYVMLLYCDTKNKCANKNYFLVNKLISFLKNFINISLLCVIIGNII